MHPDSVREGLDSVVRRTTSLGVGRSTAQPRRRRAGTPCRRARPHRKPHRIRRRGGGGRRRRCGLSSARCGPTPTTDSPEAARAGRLPRRRALQRPGRAHPERTRQGRPASVACASAQSTSSRARRRPVAIVSMTASSHGDVPRGMGFLLSRNRINVAVISGTMASDPHSVRSTDLVHAEQRAGSPRAGRIYRALPAHGRIGLARGEVARARGTRLTDEVTSGTGGTLHPTATALAEALAHDAGSRAEIVRGDDGNWLAVEEVSSTITFVEAQGDELRIVPFVGDADAIGERPFTRDIRASWLDGEREFVADVSALSSYADRGQVIDLMQAALDYWTRSAEETTPDPAPPSAVARHPRRQPRSPKSTLLSPSVMSRVTSRGTSRLLRSMRNCVPTSVTSGHGLHRQPAYRRSPTSRSRSRSPSRRRASASSCVTPTCSSAPNSHSRARLPAGTTASGQRSTFRCRRESCRRWRNDAEPTA